MTSRPAGSIKAWPALHSQAPLPHCRGSRSPRPPTEYGPPALRPKSTITTTLTKTLIINMLIKLISLWRPIRLIFIIHFSTWAEQFRGLSFVQCFCLMELNLKILHFQLTKYSRGRPQWLQPILENRRVHQSRIDPASRLTGPAGEEVRIQGQAATRLPDS